MNDASISPVMFEITDIVRHCDEVLAHAWMVRTFIKHCEEIDDYTELMGIVRAVFDISRALETRLADPAGYLKMLNKKLSKLRQAVEQFAVDAPKASTHTNFQQAVKSMNVCLRELQTLSAQGQKLLATLLPAAATDVVANDDDADESAV
ncbi:MAG: amidohydrolase [Planctomycetia bacterium]|nr:amidohydrolase [Planctomycetia bacterium]